MAFLGGLLSALAPMVPGIVSTIGDIAGKIFNRGDKGIGETLLEAAPSALSGISKVASGLAPAIGGTAGDIISKLGQGAGALGSIGAQPRQSIPRLPSTASVTQLVPGSPEATAAWESFAGNRASAAADKAKYDRTQEINNQLYKRGPFYDWVNAAYPGGGWDDTTYRHDPEYYRRMADASPSEWGNIEAEWLAKEVGPPKFPWTGTAPSLSATDHLPMIHGPSSQPIMSQSGPLSIQGVSPAQSYLSDGGSQPAQNESTQTMAPRSIQTGPMQPMAIFPREERTTTFSHGASPSFNIFDRLASRPREVEREIVETMPEEEPVKTIIRYIKRKEVKKAKKKAKKATKRK